MGTVHDVWLWLWFRKGHRASGTGKGSHTVDAAINKKNWFSCWLEEKSFAILHCQWNHKSTYTVCSSSRLSAPLSLSLSLSHTHACAHTQTRGVSDGHNSKVTDALERVVSYHTSVVQHSSQVRRDAVGSACWCKHVSEKDRSGAK